MGLVVATQTFFIFTPKIGEGSHFDEHIFQMGWFNHQLVMGFHHLHSFPTTGLSVLGGLGIPQPTEYSRDIWVVLLPT